MLNCEYATETSAYNAAGQLGRLSLLGGFFLSLLSGFFGLLLVLPLVDPRNDQKDRADNLGEPGPPGVEDGNPVPGVWRGEVEDLVAVEDQLTAEQMEGVQQLQDEHHDSENRYHDGEGAVVSLHGIVA